MSGDERKDPLFNDAVDVMFSAGRVTTMMLQRQLSIGYTRAARLIFAMLDRKIICHGPDGTPFFLASITYEEWARMKEVGA